MFISILYMLRAAICPSSGELYEYDIWYISLCIDAGLDESHANLHTKRSSIQSDIYQMFHTINSPDDGHMAARNM
jgi:hypothetical protein